MTHGALMSNLSVAEKHYFEQILDMGDGYVLDFTDATYGDFFGNHGINIHQDKRYLINGPSKAKKMRAFWEQEPEALVARVLNELLDLYEANCITKDRDCDVNVLQQCRNAIDRLSGRTNNTRPTTYKDFLEKNVDIPNLHKLPVESAVVEIIEERLREAEIVSKAGAHLSAIFLCGSVLEAVLLGAANKKPMQFNQAGSRPKTREGNVKRFTDWSLSDLINVACEIGLLEPDVKKFSHGLRDFRNYIHPYQQLSSGFTPDKHTASLCFQVLKLVLVSVAGER